VIDANLLAAAPKAAPRLFDDAAIPLRLPDAVLAEADMV